jgi:hypothetical protein
MVYFGIGCWGIGIAMHDRAAQKIHEALFLQFGHSASFKKVCSEFFPS